MRKFSQARKNMGDPHLPNFWIHCRSFSSSRSIANVRYKEKTWVILIYQFLKVTFDTFPALEALQMLDLENNKMAG